MKKIDHFSLDIDKGAVLRVIDCSPDSPVYEQVLEQYDEMLALFTKTIAPVGGYASAPYDMTSNAYAFTRRCESVIYCLYTLGKPITDTINEMFNTGEYLNGMLLDAMSDIYLGKLYDFFRRRVNEEFSGGKTEPLVPFRSLNHLYQADIVAAVNLGLSYTSGYMLDPVKSGSFVVGTGPFLLTVRQGESDTASVIEVPVDELAEGPTGENNLLDIIRQNGIKISSPCSGRGTCGKCKVFVKKGSLEVTGLDLKFLSQEEINKGCRLACGARLKTDAEILIAATEEEFQVMTGYVGSQQDHQSKAQPIVKILKASEIFAALPDSLSLSKFLQEEHGLTVPVEIYRRLAERLDSENLNDCCLFVDDCQVLEVFEGSAKALGIAIDIGTTTIGLELVDLLTSQRLCNHSMINSQRAYGADVVTRILNVTNGKLSELNNLIINDLLNGITALLEKASASVEDVKRMAISGNTTMIHLLLGVSCRSIGQSPFVSTVTSLMRYSFRDVFGSGLLNCPVIILPAVSAYVGADISAGMIFCDMSKTALLIDIGTNGEMALFNKSSLLVTSTAAGPAFEGGNISCGTGSIPGAVSKVSVDKSSGSLAFNIETIGNEPPIGFCGSGVMDLVACLAEAEILDETGVLDEDYFDDGVLVGSLSFTQKDVRELQLAKSAIRSGLDVLLDVAGLTYDDLDQVYLAGGFGYHMNLQSAAAIGLIPKELLSKVTAVGNSSLGGCVRVLTDAVATEEMLQLVASAKEVNLSTNKKFNQLFMENMYF